MSEAVRVPTSTFSIFDDQSCPLEAAYRRFGVLQVAQRPKLVELKAFPDDACRQHQLLHVRLEAIEARSQERLDRFRDPDFGRPGQGSPVITLADESALVDQHPQEFLAEERIALGARDDLRPEIVRELLDVQEAANEGSRLGVVQRLEVDDCRVRPACAPARLVLQELRSSDSHDHQWDVERALDDAGKDVDHDRVRPLKIVHHDDGR